jgi:hypothetical protein
MSVSEDDSTRKRKRPPVVTFIVFALIIGLTGFFRVAGKPRFESYHTLDVAQLLLSGACFGAAIAISIFTPTYSSLGQEEIENIA